MPIYITENGTTSFGEADWKPQGRDDVIDDQHRQEFLEGYLGAVATVVKEDGVDVRSYFGWTVSFLFISPHSSSPPLPLSPPPPPSPLPSHPTHPTPERPF